MRHIHLFILLLACSFAACTDPGVKTDNLHHESLKASYELFPNPERGFHHFKEYFSPIPTPLNAGSVQTIYDLGYTLILTNYYLSDYMDAPIPEEYLDVIRQNMQALREGGCKCILRFAYTNSDKKQPFEAPLETILLHISQIKPILQENADVIYVMEAGFIGAWGEWYYTTHFKQNPQTDADYAPRREVLDALLDALPAERQICVRTPKFKMRCYGWTLQDTLTRAEAFANTAKARLASHDDAFMANTSDMGTFKTVADRQYWEAETKYTIYGGESNQPGSYANCDNTTAQMQAMHMSYLNISYHKTVIARWQSGGCLDDMRRLLGYRLVGTDVATTMTPKAGEELKVVITLQNEGFAAPKNPRDVRVLLISKADPKNVLSFTPNCDPRFWGPEGEHKVEASFRPKVAGEYDVCLYLPDPKPTLANDPRYAIRMANENCWDKETGYNYLTTVKVE